jgi:argininosuccinate lyase
VAAGVLTETEAVQIDAGLQEIAEETASGRPLPDGSEDIHMAIETRLIEKVGAVGGKLHTGRSRNDQVALDLRLYVRDAAGRLERALVRLQTAVAARAEEQIDTILPGYTHTQRAQPVLLAHHLLAYVEMARRDRGRIQDTARRADESPLGAGALAGSGFPLDRERLARDLGFQRATANSMDAVSDRDFVVELLAALSLVMVHLSRLSAEIVAWTSAEYGFAELPDSLASGSSMMPNKKNPCAAELVRAKTGRVAGDLVAMLMVVKGLPLAYNRDLQEDKDALFDGVDTALAALDVTTRLVQGIRFKPDAMRAAALGGFTLATEAADYLTRKGLPFRQAHRVAGQAVAHAIAAGKRLEELSLEDWQRLCPLADAGLFDHLNLESAVRARAVFGGTAPSRVKEALDRAKA